MKVLSLDNLALELKYRPSWKSIALCHGCFDLLHIGHIRHFRDAKKMATLLVVTITPDIYVAKGKGRPLFDERLRAESVASVRHVDYVAINQWPSAVEAILAIKPAIYCKGNEYDGNMTEALKKEEEAVNSIGGRLIFVGEDMTHSSRIIESLSNPFQSLEGELCE